ncbi:DUF4864 domain-containing protein [Rhodobacteraceae bacterium 2CG4]|uniref:DUF4864 domain-containing protein n=1 Tax=Halovulum marinum TaxID=2662447 RepID=A0A6L5YW51_9RHOB|nr:DUF4864 domain-containing protein [Halovulum marinum]MSU88055.1 DUF4864 domain-containing protein [Halovulum marinum]
MRTTLLAAAVALGLAGPAPAQGVDTQIRDVIGGQIEALRADDFAKAFTFASPQIQGLFGTAERFGDMVRQGYPMVWRPSDIRFGGLTERGGASYQSVLITDQAGEVHLLEYEMVMTSDGWEINGVRFLRPGAFGA